MADADEELQLLLKLQAGDPRAVENLYDVCGRRAFGLAFHLVGNAAEAEDIVQEAFLALWQHAERLDPERGHVVPLLLTIVHHRATDHLRRSGREHPAPIPDILAVEGADPAESIVGRENRTVIKEAIAALPDTQRRTLKLAYLAGYSHSEIAAVMKTPVGTVKSRLRLALERLSLILKPKVET
jgi:RNA polymerase sigma-70 factor, ECF subfamily